VVNEYLITAGAARHPGERRRRLVVETKCNYFSELAFPATGRCRPARSRTRAGRACATSWRCSVARRDGQRRRGHFVHVYVDRATRRPAPLPPELRAAVERLPRLNRLELGRACGRATEETSMGKQRIAVIPGDGIGRNRGRRACGCSMQRRAGSGLTCTSTTRLRLVRLLRRARPDDPADWKDRIGGHDAIFYGAVGWPATVARSRLAVGSLLKFRREFDQYINLRPVQADAGDPLAAGARRRQPARAGRDRLRRRAREHRGEYLSIGGRMFEGTEREFAIQETVMTRIGVDRVVRFAFELASKRPAAHLTRRPSPNGISITMPYWTSGRTVAAGYPQSPRQVPPSTSCRALPCAFRSGSTSWSPPILR